MTESKLIRWDVACAICLNGKGEYPVTEWVTGNRLFDRLLDKLLEEANELCHARTYDQMVEEWGDVEQAVRDILCFKDIAWGWLRLHGAAQDDTPIRERIIAAANAARRATSRELKPALEQVLTALRDFCTCESIDPWEAERMRLLKLRKKGGFVKDGMGLVLVRVIRLDSLAAA